MEPAVRALLDSADDTEGVEVPGNDWNALPDETYEREILAIQKRIRDDFGIDVQRDGKVEDASFFDDLRVVSKVASQSNTYHTLLCIRFSNFGKLFTVCSSLDSIPREYPLPSIVGLVEGFGWCYVPADALDEPYDGKNERLREADISWWIRFFDYV